MSDDCYHDEYIKDLCGKVQFLLDNYVETDDGFFCFPDGDTWESHYKKEVAP